MTPVNWREIVALRTPSISSATEISSPLRYFSAMTSSKSHTASINLSRYSLVWASHLSRHRHRLRIHTQLVSRVFLEQISDILHQIDETGEIFFLADGQEDRDAH